jgi:hypothetical protein
VIVSTCTAPPAAEPLRRNRLEFELAPGFAAVIVV